MERAPNRHRQWRESMSPSERDAYLERRRAIAQGKRPRVESDPTETAAHGSGILKLGDSLFYLFFSYSEFIV